MLIDRFGRIHNYLRISLTDSCNFRCSYCMPEKNFFLQTGRELMQPKEIEEIAKVFVSLGISKIRLTGGEPLVRKDAEEIILRLSHLPVNLTLTTNGSRLNHYISIFKKAGIKAVNVSLDSLIPEQFARITQKDNFEQVWRNIMLLLENNIRVKLNTVAVSGIIEKELYNFIELTRELPLHVRFIEFMPFPGNQWQSNKVITSGELVEMIEKKFDLAKLSDEPYSTARSYRISGFRGTIAFITTMSNNFCSECNRIRLTANGKIKNCLFGKEETDILTPFRNGDPIEPLIRKSIIEKHETMGGQFEKGYYQVNPKTIENRNMTHIGG
jgi:GTP 3',8-cyclase